MSARYTVVQRDRAAGPGADYLYDLFRDGQHVGVFAHTFRGDEPRLEMDGGPFLETDWLVENEAPGRLVLNAAGVALLDRLLGR